VSLIILLDLFQIFTSSGGRFKLITFTLRTSHKFLFGNPLRSSSIYLHHQKMLVPVSNVFTFHMSKPSLKQQHIYTRHWKLQLQTLIMNIWQQYSAQQTDQRLEMWTWNMWTLLLPVGCSSCSESTTDFLALDFAKSSYNWT